MNINLTLLGQSITFVIFVWFCMRFAWPPIKAMMAERQEAIATGLRAAQDAEERLAKAASDVDEEIKRAKAEAAKIIEAARTQSAQMIDEAKNAAKEEADRILESAKSDIDQDMNRAKETLRRELSGLVITAAEQVLQDSVDGSKHEALLERLAGEL
mgnify:FL=1